MAEQSWSEKTSVLHFVDILLPGSRDHYISVLDLAEVKTSTDSVVYLTVLLPRCPDIQGRKEKQEGNTTLLPRETGEIKERKIGTYLNVLSHQKICAQAIQRNTLIDAPPMHPSNWVRQGPRKIGITHMKCSSERADQSYSVLREEFVDIAKDVTGRSHSSSSPSRCRCTRLPR